MYINAKISVHRYTLVFVYYAFCLASMVLVRPLLSVKFVPHHGTKSIYAALFFYPVLICLHAVLAGLVCKYYVSLCLSACVSITVVSSVMCVCVDLSLYFDLCVSLSLSASAYVCLSVFVCYCMKWSKEGATEGGRPPPGAGEKGGTKRAYRYIFRYIL